MTKLPGAIAGARVVGERFVHSQRQQHPEGRMPFMDHLRELRNRIVKMALALAAGTAAGFIFFDQAWAFIERPLCHTTINGHSGCATPGTNQLILNSPLDPFYLRVKVAFIVGVILSSPVWLYQLLVPVDIRLVDHGRTASPDERLQFGHSTQEHAVGIVQYRKSYRTQGHWLA